MILAAMAFKKSRYKPHLPEPKGDRRQDNRLELLY